MKTMTLARMGWLALIWLLTTHLLQAQEFKVVGYLPTYRFHFIDQIQLDKVTHLNLAFASPTSDGHLTTYGVDMLPIVQQAQARGLEVYIAISGAGTVVTDWSAWLRPGNRSTFIHNIMTYVRQHNFQGVDVDIEWGYVTDDYSGFVLELRDSLDRAGLKMTAALPGTYRYPEVSDAALAAFDWVNMMVYDLRGPWAPDDPGQHSPYSFAEDAIQYWQLQGVEKSRLTLGVPFYGYNFANPSSVVSVTYRQMVELNPYYANFDRVASAFFNGIPTIERKTTLALDEQLAGIMIWELGQDHFGVYSLLSRIDSIIHLTPTPVTAQDVITPRVHVYPNPTWDLLQVDIDYVGSVFVRLHDSNGRVVRQMQTVTSGPLAINVQQLPAGLYVLSVQGAGWMQSAKVSIL